MKTLTNEEKEGLALFDKEVRKYANVTRTFLDDSLPRRRVWAQTSYEGIDFQVGHYLTEIRDWKSSKPVFFMFDGIKVETPAEYDGTYTVYTNDWARYDASWRAHAWMKSVSALITGHIKVYEGEIFKPENYNRYVSMVNYRALEKV